MTAQLIPAHPENPPVRDFLKSFWLDWVNNFVSFKYMADYYGLEEPELVRMLHAGKRFHEEDAI